MLLVFFEQLQHVWHSAKGPATIIGTTAVLGFGIFFWEKKIPS